MSDKIFGLYLEQIAQRLSDDIRELKEHLPSESTEPIAFGLPNKVWPALENLETTKVLVDTAATTLIRSNDE